jgi:hypothetical protein
MSSNINPNINLFVKNYVDSLMNTNMDLIPLNINDINPVNFQDNSLNYYNIHSSSKEDISYSYIQLNNSLHNEPNTIILKTNKNTDIGEVKLYGDLHTTNLNSEIIKSSKLHVNDSNNINDNIIHITYDDENLYCENNNNEFVDISSILINTGNILTNNILTQIGSSDITTNLKIKVNNSILSENIIVNDRVITRNINAEELALTHNNYEMVKLTVDPNSSSQDSIRVYENTGTYNSSDPRFKYKESLLDISFSSNIIQNINSYKYKYKKENDSERYDYGFMADEVQGVLPDAVYTKSTLIDNENVSCSYEMIYDSSYNLNNIILKNIKDNEFDKECQFYMMYCSCDFSSIPVYEVKIEISECLIDTTHNIYYIGQYQTDHIREYLYAYKNDIRIKIDGNEYKTRLKYNPNNETNRITIDISGLPITSGIKSLEIYRPIECVTYVSDVIDTNDNDDNTRNYILNIPSDIDNELKNIDNGEMIWYKVGVKDGKSLDYRKIFMQYHNVIKDKYNENIKLKTKLEELEKEVEEIEKYVENM